ncbi:MAG: phosphoglycolate phosphatase [Burkholderiales bacterium]
MKFPIEIRAVAFDLDGTLVETLPDLHEAANRMLADIGRFAVTEATVRGYVGNGVQRLVARLLDADEVGEPVAELFDRAAASFDRHYTEVLTRASTPYPDVFSTLASLRHRGLKLACVTNKPKRFAEPLLKHLALMPALDLVLSGDSLSRKKPDPLPLLHVAGVFGVPPARLLMIGDSSADTGAARAAGCPVFCVPYGYRGNLEVQELDCDAIVPTLNDVLELIRFPE